jgi:Tetratricopeptide repeat
MATSEIDKLERRYAENPHGLTFAPLAEVHRKNGDIPRALELLRIGLELHPNYIPASIVLGRCHQDLGDLPAAEAAFAHVLRLDDENVIALKSLADMNERQDRLDEAERWLQRLVSVDRSNDEARQQLDRIRMLKGEIEHQPTAPTAPPIIPENAAVEVAEPETPVAGPPRASIPERPTEQTDTAALELMEDLDGKDVGQASEPAMQQSSAPVKEESPSPPETLLEQPEAVSGGSGAARLPGLESAEFEPPKTAPAELGPLGLEIETESDVVLNSSGATEFSVPDASQDLAALAAKWTASRPRSPGRRASDRSAAEVREPAASAPVTPAQSARPPLPAEPVGAPKAYSAQATNGQSIAAFFQVLLAARPPESTSGTGTVPLAPGSNSNGDSPSASAQAGEVQEGLVSFDDFFGSAAGGKSRGAEPGKDDLDQFHSWLQNLKR